MEYNKINNLLLSEDNESEKFSKFVTREYVRVNSLPNAYNENKSIRFKTPMLRSNLCDYSDAHILKVLLRLRLLELIMMKII